MVKTDAIDMTIRPMAVGDIDTIFQIEVETFTDSWPKEAFVDRLGEDWTANFVALHKGNIVGYLCAVGQVDELHIHNIAVSVPFRRRGIGRLLLAEAEAWGRKKQKLCMILDVRASNTEAVSFYKTLGYEKTGRRKGYYCDPPEDALVFMKAIQENIAKHM